MTRHGFASLVVTILVAACASAPSSNPASPSAPAAPSASAEPTPGPAAFDFNGTGWRVEGMDGQPLTAGSNATLTFDSRDGVTGSGAAFSGCTEFGFEWTLEAGQAEIRPQGVDLGTCSGVPGQVEAAFLARLAGATAYSVNGDILTLAGPAGQIQLRRDAPPVGDPGRAVLDLLRVGEWRVITAPGIAAGQGPSGIRFGDTRLSASGNCGLSGSYRLLPQGGVKFEEIGWDTGGEGGCGNARELLKPLLESATTARVGADGATIVISGPNGEVVLGR